MFATPLEHLQCELARLDLLFHREILRLRASYQLSLDEFRGLYIGDEQVDGLLRQAGGDGQVEDIALLSEQAEALRRRALAGLDPAFPWARLLDTFRLSPLEGDLLLLALAPELEIKYETLTAYLNNDVTRRWPTPALALRLLARAPEEQLAVRAALLPGAALFAGGLLQPGGPEREVSWLASGFRPAPELAQMVLGLPPESLLDPRVASLRRSAPGWDGLPVAPELAARLRRLGEMLSNRDRLVVALRGRDGSGRFAAAAAVCAEAGRAVLNVRLPALLGEGSQGEGAAARIGQLARCARLAGAWLYLSGGESLLAPDDPSQPAGQALAAALGDWADFPGPLFLALPPGVHPRGLAGERRAVLVDFPDPSPALRRQAWARGAAARGLALSPGEAETLASRFVLAPGQIENALQAAADWQAFAGDPEAGPGLDGLLQAAREQTGLELGQLAIKVPPLYRWNDLVLPAVTLRRVRQVAATIQNNATVYGEWGFARRVANSRGLNVLFSGASGTGKTMTASVIARELGLDLYKIDVSGIVSKYIGETEKNLDRIFRAAHASNAILFFDEADALFGKRSEVKDAHDRYANIEVAYLLQKMEEHQGVVILASNLSKNIDPAFARRMHYVVEFPLPDEAHRERLWRGMFPPEAPLAADIDFPFLARQFALPGGDIKNAALEAAFLAAQDGRVIGMPHLVRALAQQAVKQGRLPSASDFKQYFGMIGNE